MGLAVAREALLRRPDDRVVVLEREAAVGRHQTGRNSGVVHAGIYYAPGSLKARLCVAGARELAEYCEATDVPLARPGKVIVAVRPEELARLEELERRGRRNGVPALRRIGPSELAEIEPHVRGHAALHSPTTGTVDFGRVAEVLAAEVRARGGAVAASCPVSRPEPVGRRVRLPHPTGEVRARGAAFCAGPWSDGLARAAGAPADPRIVPFKGAYLRLRPERRHLVRGLVYPVPEPELPFLGIHLTRHLDGEVLVGPTALPAASRDVHRPWRPAARDLYATVSWPGTWRLARRQWRSAAAELHRTLSRRALASEAARYVPEITAGDLGPAFAGIRAQALARDGQLIDDFVVSETERSIHVRNAPSPAATAAIPLARLIVDRLERIQD